MKKLLLYCEFRKSQCSENHSSSKGVSEIFIRTLQIYYQIWVQFFSKDICTKCSKDILGSREAVQERPCFPYGLNKLLLRVYTDIILHFEV